MARISTVLMSGALYPAAVGAKTSRGRALAAAAEGVRCSVRSFPTSKNFATIFGSLSQPWIAVPQRYEIHQYCQLRDEGGTLTGRLASRLTVLRYLNFSNGGLKF